MISDRKGGSKMQGQATHIVSKAIRYIEDNLNNKLDLETVAAALHYSKFHLHRMFTKTIGHTIHEYVGRRQLTEAAKLLVFSMKPIIEISLISGYESQQAFTGVFKAMYKTTPAQFREAEEFYPLQLEIRLKEEPIKMEFTKDAIQFAAPSDVPDWLELVNFTIDGFPHLNEADYAKVLQQCITEKRALILRDDDMAIGVMMFSADTGSIDFLAVHPQYRNLGIAKIFLDKLMDELLCGKEISITTFREGDKADTGYREELHRLGFAERELLIEFSYPTQRLALPPKHEEDVHYDTGKN